MAIFYGLDGYSKTREEAVVQARDMKIYLKHLDLAGREQKAFFSSPEYKSQIGKKIANSRLQDFLESAGSAVIYAVVFTILTAPLLYFLTQPRLFKSYAIETLLMGSFLFYFVFGFVVIYLTARSIDS